MNKFSLREQAAFKVFINRFDPSLASIVERFMQQDPGAWLKAPPVASSDLTPLVDHPTTFIHTIHYSWLAPVIQELPPALRSAAIASLTPEQITGLQAIAPPMALSLPAKKYLRYLLYQKLEGESHLPIDYLPQEPLSFCLEWKKTQWIQFFDFFGLYDLSSEVRQIVNRDYLKNIYTCLTSKQFYYLKMCMQQKERLAFPKLGIDPSKQDSAKLKRLIHQRGLIRFGKALCGHSFELVWHIAHRLDVGRGTILLREYAAEEINEVTAVLKRQVLHLTDFLNSEDFIHK